MTYEHIDQRPAKNHRTIKDPSNWDIDMELALLSTITKGGAIKIPLADFHSSPAKGRLFSLGYKLRHRVLPGKAYVADWLEEPKQEETEI